MLQVSILYKGDLLREGKMVTDLRIGTQRFNLSDLLLKRLEFGFM